MTPKKTEYVCINEEKLQDHGLQLKELESRADFKDQRIDELNAKMDKMEEKLDDISKNVNQLILQATQQDNQLEIRLTKIETDMQNQKQEMEKRFKNAPDSRNPPRPKPSRGQKKTVRSTVRTSLGGIEPSTSP